MKCFFIALLLITVHKVHGQNSIPGKQPNIVFIIGDDISAEDIGCYGNASIRTPNIDNLAKQGIRFTNMYVTSSSCSPSRSSILTGRYPHNTGAAELHLPLPKHLTFFPELLRKSGYYTAQLGKWHEGPETLRAYDTLSYKAEINGNGGEEQWINTLRNRPKEKPFFFWLAPLDAHREWSADSFGQPYKPSEVMVPPTLADTKETRQDLASYYNEIARIDHYLGELEKELARQGIADNTIIIFMADNARPFAGNKTHLYDRGLRTPFVIKWPKGIRQKGAVCESLVSAVDIAPTFLELAGTSTAESIQGVSFAGLLKEPKRKFRHYVFGEHNWHDYESYERSVRTDSFLYIINKRPQFDNGGPTDVNQSPSAKALKAAKKNGTLTPLQNDVFIKPRPVEEFFDVRRDPLQARNLAGDKRYENQLAQLKSVLQKWQDETADTEPTALTPDWYDRETGIALPAKGTRGESPGTAKKADRVNAKGPF